MSRTALDLNGYETDLLRVVRRATDKEKPRGDRTDVFWIVECKTCGKTRPVRSSRVKTQPTCKHCHGLKLLASREDKVIKRASFAWKQLQDAVTALDLDAIETTVKLLRRYDTIMKRRIRDSSTR